MLVINEVWTIPHYLDANLGYRRAPEPLIRSPNSVLPMSRCD
jgi:hypothetical protein